MIEVVEANSFEGSDKELSDLVRYTEDFLTSYGTLENTDFSPSFRLDRLESGLEARRRVLWARKGSEVVLAEIYLEAYDLGTISEQFQLNQCAEGLHRLYTSKRQVKAIMNAATLKALKLTSWSRRPDSTVIFLRNSFCLRSHPP